MSKKINFGAKPMPKTALNEVDAWVEKGSLPQQSKESILESQNTTTDPNIKRLTLRLPEDLHKKLKIYCVNHNINMTDKLIRVISEELRKNVSE